MTYELARELKEAGFPQHEESVPASGDNFYPHEDRGTHRTFDQSAYPYSRSAPDFYDQGKWRPSQIFVREWLDSSEGREDTLYFPSLSELIEACGEGYFALERSQLGWQASRGLEDVIVGPYKTPEEAVARLWLSLNKHGAD